MDIFSQSGAVERAAVFDPDTFVPGDQDQADKHANLLARRVQLGEPAWRSDRVCQVMVSDLIAKKAATDRIAARAAWVAANPAAHATEQADLAAAKAAAKAGA